MTPTGPFFEGYAFRPDFGELSAERGRIFVQRRVFYFQSDGQDLDIPLGRLQVEFGVGSDTELCFSDSANPVWTICTSDDALLNHPEMKYAPQLRDQLGALLGRDELKRRLKITVGVLLGCILAAWLGSLAVSAMVRKVVSWVPLATEEKWGRDELQALAKHEEFIEDPKRVAHLEKLARPLMEAALPGQNEFKIHIMDAPFPNAFALPGGHVIVTTGLLKMVDRPEELLGVLAHELAHVTQRHALRKTISSAGPVLIFTAFARQGGGTAHLLASGSALLVQQSFSQEYETEADSIGWDYLVAANIDPRGMIEMFRKFQAYDREETDLSPNALRSHPPTKKRIKTLEGKWDSLKTKEGFLTLDTAPL